MDNLTEIKAKLDNYYQEYKDNKNTLNGGKTKEVAKYIVEISSLKDGNLHDAAVELARFSADVVNIYFETITKDNSLPIEFLDEIIKEFLQTDTDASKSQYYVQKFVFAITSIMKNYKEKALMSAQLPKLVVFIAKFAVKSDKNRNKFQTLIDNTMGGIFRLNYAGINTNSLLNVWNATNTVFPDLTKAKFESFIVEWANKYGFIKEDSESHAANERAVKTEKVISSKEQSADAPKLAKEQAFATVSSKEQETIITALTDMITPIGKALESIQGEINKSREIGAENVSLKARIENLECQLSEQHSKLQEVNQSLMATKTENEELKKQISVLESKNSELDSKLNDAYTINSRESSLEAEKIRTNLKKDFEFLYEDWLEYEFSDVSEDNYESLQAIIKKVFRSLERNGIDFKEKK